MINKITIFTRLTGNHLSIGSSYVFIGEGGTVIWERAFFEASDKFKLDIFHLGVRNSEHKSLVFLIKVPLHFFFGGKCSKLNVGVCLLKA